MEVPILSLMHSAFTRRGAQKRAARWMVVAALTLALPISCSLPAARLAKRIESAMVVVPAGSFRMGSLEGRPDAAPIHEVAVTRAFSMLRHEVTFLEYDEYCELSGAARPADASRGRGDMAVVNVSFSNAVKFCNFMSVAAGLTPCYDSSGFTFDAAADGYRLPSEAEWEYAARGGPAADRPDGGFAYSGSSIAEDVAWFGDLDNPRPVEGKAPNALGLFDMSGNVWEWCNDWYSGDYYAKSPAVDPRGASYADVAGGYGAKRVRRGGNYHESADNATVWARSCDVPSQADTGMGFRIVRTLTARD